MIVKWNEDRLKVVPVTSAKKEMMKEVKNKSGKANIILLPGTNDVHNGDWEIAKEHLALDIKLKRIEVFSDVEAKKVKGKDGKEKTNIKESPKSLSRFDPDEASVLIKECNNMETLKYWKQKDKRDDVRSEILSRMDEIKDYIHNSDKEK